MDDVDDEAEVGDGFDTIHPTTAPVATAVLLIAFAVPPAIVGPGLALKESRTGTDLLAAALMVLWSIVFVTLGLAQVIPRLRDVGATIASVLSFLAVIIILAIDLREPLLTQWQRLGLFAGIVALGLLAVRLVRRDLSRLRSALGPDA